MKTLPLLRRPPVIALALALLAGCNSQFVIDVPTGKLVSPGPTPSGKGTPSPAPSGSVKPGPSPSAIAGGPQKATITFDSKARIVTTFKIDVHASGEVDYTLYAPDPSGQMVGKVPPALVNRLFADIASYLPVPQPPGAVCTSAQDQWQTLDWDKTSVSTNNCPTATLNGSLLADVNAIEASLGLSTDVQSASPAPTPAGDIVISHSGPPLPDPNVPANFEVDIAADGQAKYSLTAGTGSSSGPLDVPADLLKKLFADASQPVAPPPEVECNAVSPFLTKLTYGGKTFSDQVCGGFWPDNLKADVTAVEALLPSTSSMPSPTPMPSTEATTGVLDLTGDWQAGTDNEPPAGPVKAPQQQCYVQPSFSLKQGGMDVSGSVPQPISGAAPQFRTDTSIKGTVDGDHVMLTFTSTTMSFIQGPDRPQSAPTVTSMDLSYNEKTGHLTGTESMTAADGTVTTRPYWAARWVGNGLNCPPPP